MSPQKNKVLLYGKRTIREPNRSDAESDSHVNSKVSGSDE
jgi:hypothetical protein